LVYDKTDDDLMRGGDWNIPMYIRLAQAAEANVQVMAGRHHSNMPREGRPMSFTQLNFQAGRGNKDRQ